MKPCKLCGQLSKPDRFIALPIGGFLCGQCAFEIHEDRKNNDNNSDFIIKKLIDRIEKLEGK